MSETTVLHTRLLEGSENAYEQAHKTMSADVQDALRRAGFVSWQVFREDQNLVHIIEADDYRKSMELFLADPNGNRWHTEMGKLQKPNSEGRIKNPMKVIWKLSGAD